MSSVGEAADERSPYFVQSLERGLAVIRAFGADRAECSLSEVARATGLTRAAARRFLLTLVDLGYVRTDGRVYSLTPRVMELGYAFLSGMTLPQVAEPHLEELAVRLHESTSVSVLDGGDIVYVARVPVSRIMTVGISVGTRFPAYATSMGRVLLAGLAADDLDALLEAYPPRPLTDNTRASADELRAELDRVRSAGWAVVDQELEEGLRSVAAPLRDRDGQVVAAINVSTQASRTSVAQIHEQLLPHLLVAAKQIEDDLAAAPGTPVAAPAAGVVTVRGGPRDLPARR